MSLEIWRIICIILVAVGTAGGALLTIKIDSVKGNTAKVQQKQLTEKIDGLTQGNERLQEKLKPFENLAGKMYPGIEADAALGRLSREIQDIKQETQLTVLVSSPLQENELSNGSFEYTFNLEPEGKNVIPILSISAKSIDGVKINSINIQGSTLPIMSESGGSDDGTSQHRLYRSVQPTSFKIVINTAKKTRLKIGIVPLKPGA